MVDTVKLRHLKSRRRPNGPGGRVEHDALGNAVWTRSRASDSDGIPDTSALSILEDTSGTLPVDAKTEREQSGDLALKRAGRNYKRQ